MKIWGCSLVVCLGVSAAFGQQYTIQTVAGTGTAEFDSDSGTPSTAQFRSPSAIALDSQGNLFVADTGNHCVRKITSTAVTTFAGTCETAGYTGDGEAATSAKLYLPAGLAFDSSGNLYIVDTGNGVIRKVVSGNISTVAGDMTLAGTFSGDGGAATSAALAKPTSIAFDAAGNMYIADSGNNLVRRVDAATQIITTYVGASGGTVGTSGKLSAPTGVWVAASGALYIADSNNQRIAKFVAPASFTNFAGSNIAGFAGDLGAATSAQLNKPTTIFFDAAGNLFIADTNNSRIRKISTDGTIATIAGKGGGSYSGDGYLATAAGLNFPRGIVVASNGTVYIADTNNNVIRSLTPTTPAIASDGVANAASSVKRISPGAIASVYGTGFGVFTYQADDGYNWPTLASQVSVKVNGVAAPLYFISPGQINFQVPWSTPTTGTVSVAVYVNNGPSNVVNVPVATAAPGIFLLGDNQAAVLNSDYSVNGSSNPAAAGSIVLAYLTGSGPVSPAPKDGVPAPTDSLVYLQSTTSATVGGQPAVVRFAGLAPGFVGLVQMNIQVPAGLAPGVYPIVVTIDGQASNSATIAVK
jgi:uncharacterized protein (TIGR03437 family)